MKRPDSKMYTVNIPKSSDDPFYRYKRHILVVTETSKYGGTTIVTNADVVAKEIYRTLDDLKFLFTKTLGTSVVKKDQGLSLRGKYSQQALEVVLENYIMNGVLCHVCGNPETVKEGKNYRCNACGNTQHISHSIYGAYTYH